MSIPNGWKIERLDDERIRITDPMASYPVTLTLYESTLRSRIMWRLATALLEEDDGRQQEPASAQAAGS